MLQSKIITAQIDVLDNEAKALLTTLAEAGTKAILWDRVAIMTKVGQLAEAMTCLSNARGALYTAEKIGSELKTYNI